MTFKLSRIAFLAAAALVAAVFASATNAQNVKINEAPLRDFAKDVQTKIDKKEIDVTKPFAVEMSALIKDDGTLDKNASKFTSESGDAKMVEVAKQAVWAMGASGYFDYLVQAGISRPTLLVSQTAQTFTGSVRASKGRLEATMITSGVNTMLSLGRSQDMQPNEKLIIENTHASHDGGNIDITCTLPAAEFQRMILGSAAAASGPSN